MSAFSDQDSGFLDAILASPSYIPADRDLQFLQRDELRSLRLQLELLKPELIQKEQGIQSTIVVFGSARLSDPHTAHELLQLAEARLSQAPDDPLLKQQVSVARHQLALAKYYDVAREFG